MAKVLIIDDAAFMRMTIRRMLERNGHEVAGEADDGDVGVQLYKELNPDMVTMDITMANLNGLEALKQIMEFDSNAKVLMVSAMGQDTIIRNSIVLGAKSFIVKPFVETRFIDTINKILF